MKTKLIITGLIFYFFNLSIFAQNQTRINTYNSEISANLDLRAVASLFGESKNLDDFENRLNNPSLQISNLDLNNDNQVDYLRVVESVDNNTHLIVLQAVLDQNVFQDVASIDVDRDYKNQVNVQIVGNPSIYGNNYIYEPVYYTQPSLINLFWNTNYRPYTSIWKWNYYPNRYRSWRPIPIYKYNSNINICLNNQNRYNFVNYRKSQQAAYLYQNRYTNQYPNNNYYNSSYHKDYDYDRNYNNYNRNNESRYQSGNYSNDYRKNWDRRESRSNSSSNYNLGQGEIEVHKNKTQYVEHPMERGNRRENRESNRRH